ncbi:MAG: hypothetical protein LBR37_00655 [Erysipelotrichaceae bacterium]|jgi:uncharacterized membrane protein|nr:hypothetical protein [Erysipelotrichaceae bacterium]
MTIREYESWLRRELSASFYTNEEIDEVVSYYLEIINDRVDAGERLEQVLFDYPPRKIALSFASEAYQRREVKTKRDSGNVVGKVVKYTFLTPFLIPLGILLIVFLIVAGALVISFFASLLGVGGYGVYLLVNIIQSGVAIKEIIAYSALIVAAMGVLLILAGLGVLLFKGVIKLIIKIGASFSRKRRNA